jgi:hypothetical protein
MSKCLANGVMFGSDTSRMDGIPTLFLDLYILGTSLWWPDLHGLFLHISQVSLIYIWWEHASLDSLGKTLQTISDPELISLQGSLWWEQNWRPLQTVCYSSWIKISQTGLNKTTEMCFFTVLKARVWKQYIVRAMLPLKPDYRILSRLAPCGCRKSTALLGPQLSPPMSTLSSLSPLAYVPLSVATNFHLLIGTPVLLDLELTLIHYNHIWTWLHPLHDVHLFVSKVIFTDFWEDLNFEDGAYLSLCRP